MIVPLVVAGKLILLRVPAKRSASYISGATGSKIKDFRGRIGRLRTIIDVGAHAYGAL